MSDALALPETINCHELPENPWPEAAYRLLPRDPDNEYYRERTDRNIGWITENEQELLRHSTVGIAGCGGMGGLLASTFIRLGIGAVRIADCETFDRSNINRQFAAMRGTVGESKAFATARLARAVSDDTELVVYPQGITEETVDAFLAGCSAVCDEIEVLALPARILLHARARVHGIPVFNCNTVGFSTNLFLYTPGSMTMEEATGITYPEALALHARAGVGDQEAVKAIVDAMMRAVVPELPEYSPEDPQTNRASFFRRFEEERKVPIIATNPPMASGFLANRVLLHLLKDSGVRRDIAETPPMPGYLSIDAAAMTARAVQEGWNPHA